MTVLAIDRMKGLKQRASLSARRRRRNDQVPVFLRAFGEQMASEMRAIRSVLSDDPGLLEHWVDEFYLDHEESMRSAFEPVVFDYGSAVSSLALEEVGSGEAVPTEMFAAEYSATLAGRWSSSSKKQLVDIARHSEPDGEADDPQEHIVAAVEERLDKWSERRPAWSADREATQAGSAFAKLAYIAAGVTSLVWRTSGGPCPICAELEGRVVGISQPFVRSGEPVGPSGEGQTPVRPQINISHPPIHGLDGKGGVCQCMISAG